MSHWLSSLAGHATRMARTTHVDFGLARRASGGALAGAWAAGLWLLIGSVGTDAASIWLGLLGGSTLGALVALLASRSLRVAIAASDYGLLEIKALEVPYLWRWRDLERIEVEPVEAALIFSGGRRLTLERSVDRWWELLSAAKKESNPDTAALASAPWGESVVITHDLERGAAIFVLGVCSLLAVLALAAMVWPAAMPWAGRVLLLEAIGLLLTALHWARQSVLWGVRADGSSLAVLSLAGPQVLPWTAVEALVCHDQGYELRTFAGTVQLPGHHLAIRDLDELVSRVRRQGADEHLGTYGSEIDRGVSLARMTEPRGDSAEGTTAQPR